MEYSHDHIIPYGAEGDKSQQVEKMFNNIAPAYDRLNYTLSLGIDHYWRRKAINRLKPVKPKRILDVATGTGDFAILACKRLKPDYLLGIDISDGMMEVAKKKSARARLERQVFFAHEDCTCLSMASCSFDAVTVAFGIRNFEGLDKGLQEMCRVLKPGGHLVILELSTPHHFPMKQLYSLYSKTVIPLIGRLISKDNSAYTYLPQSIAACPQGAEMQRVIKQAGFSEVRYETLTFGICTLYEAIK